MPRTNLKKVNKKEATSSRVNRKPAANSHVYYRTQEALKVWRNDLSTQRKLIYLLGVAIVGILGYFAYRYFFIAWVDHTPVTRTQLDSQLEKRYGKDMQDQLISETLVNNEARKRGVTATDAEIDARVKQIADQQGGQDKLNQVLQLQNMSLADLRKQIKFQILIEKMFGKDIQISDQEVKDYLSQNKDQFQNYTEDDSSQSAKTRSSVKDLLARQKVGQAFNEWLTKNLHSNRVIRL